MKKQLQFYLALCFLLSSADLNAQIIYKDNISGTISCAKIDKDGIVGKDTIIGRRFGINDSSSATKDSAYARVSLKPGRSQKSQTTFYNKSLEFAFTYHNISNKKTPELGSQSRFDSIRYNAVLVLPPSPKGSGQWDLKADFDYNGVKFNEGDVLIGVVNSDNNPSTNKITLNKGTKDVFSDFDNVDFMHLDQGSYLIYIYFPDYAESCSYKTIGTTGEQDGNLRVTINFTVTPQ